MTSLNPLFTVGEQIAETVKRHQGIGWGAALKRAADLFVITASQKARCIRAEVLK